MHHTYNYTEYERVISTSVALKYCGVFKMSNFFPCETVIVHFSDLALAVTFSHCTWLFSIQLRWTSCDYISTSQRSSL